MNANRETNDLEAKSARIDIRKAFEYASCAIGIVASIATGLAEPGSALQATTALTMGSAYGAAYFLKR